MKINVMLPLQAGEVVCNDDHCTDPSHQVTGDCQNC